MASTLGTVQPFRYRGYVYDEETGLYYLRSRYYSSILARFTQIDTLLVDRQNLYAYCTNSPVVHVDPDGEALTIAYDDTGVDPDDFKRFLRVSLLLGLGSVAILGATHAADDATSRSGRNQNNGTKYYHITTMENAKDIMKDGLLRGSSQEEYHIFAWKLLPNYYARKNSGATSTDVIISFETNAPFVPDESIDDPKVLKYAPVRSLKPGPIAVRNVHILTDFDVFIDFFKKH